MNRDTGVDVDTMNTGGKIIVAARALGYDTARLELPAQP
jgi:hypothetical protein